MEDLAHEGCSTGTAIVVLHAIVHALHGLAHVKIPVPLSSLQSLFIVAVISLAPIIATVLLWTPFDRIGSWLLVSSMSSAILFGIYNYFAVISPDHVSQVSFAGWGLLFQITAILTLIIDGFGCWFSLWALKPIQQSDIS
jgi:hypothetical protein